MRVERELYQLLNAHLVHHIASTLPCMTSITAVEVHPNLKTAKVYFRLVGDDSICEQAKFQLDERRSDFQREVARQLVTKFCPVLRFEYGLAKDGDDIDALIAQLHRPKIWSEDE